MNYLMVFLGAGIGGALRHGINSLALKLGWTGFPFATLIINVLGSMLMGVIVEYLALKSHWPQSWRLFLTTGIIGGFTTFSAFSLEAALLYERGKAHLALVYVLASVILSILALFAAMAAMRTFAKY